MLEPAHRSGVSPLNCAVAQTWSARALRAILQGVQDHAVIENIAITDAWTEDENTFCVIYTPPWGPDLAGMRRQRGDLDPVVQLLPLASAAADPALKSADEPDDYGLTVLDDISQPLGGMYERLRYDSHGVGWWGTLVETLPKRRS
jgi:hypothetical protein